MTPFTVPAKKLDRRSGLTVYMSRAPPLQTRGTCGTLFLEAESTEPLNRPNHGQRLALMAMDVSTIVGGAQFTEREHACSGSIPAHLGFYTTPLPRS